VRILDYNLHYIAKFLFNPSIKLLFISYVNGINLNCRLKLHNKVLINRQIYVFEALAIIIVDN